MLAKSTTLKITYKVLFFMISALLLSNLNNMYAQETQGGELPKHDQIQNEYTWNVADIYASEDLWEKDFKYIEENMNKYTKYTGIVAKDAATLLELLKFDEDLSIIMGKLYLYSSLSKDLDLTNSKYQAMFERINNLNTQVSTISSFVRPELVAIPEAKLAEFMKGKKDLVIYQQMFDNLYRTKAHTLSPEMEELLALAGPVEQVPYNTFSFFTGADIQYPFVKDEEGKNDIKISDGRYYAALYSTNREYRERVYKGFYQPYKDYKNTLLGLFTGNIKALIFDAKARKYDNTRQAALDGNNIPVAVYDNLVTSVNNNIASMHRWCELKKRVLNLPDFHPYDTYVTLFPGVKKEYKYEAGRDIVIKALQPLGSDYIKSLTTAFDNRWIDVYETQNKRSGAYSSGTTFGVHPYVLLNWNDELNDVFTLAHEMGHNMHSYYTGLNQPYVYAGYSIFVAEVASTTNEALLLDYLIQNAQSKEEKLALIEKQLNNITTTFFRQTRFAEFEKFVNEQSENGVALTPEFLTQSYKDMYQKYWGPAMVTDDEEGYTWARIPHFYYNFYVYQYATSYAASQAIVAKIKKEGQPAIDKYLNFLKSGKSKYPIEILKSAGVDMTTADPIIAVVNKMNQLMDEMEKLLSEK
ncbi:MAG: oligoendopeptidase F [bacterium]